MEVMVLGFARRLRQASQAASTMASWLSKTRFESQFWRRYCQMFSTGLSSGAREGRKTRVMFFGTTKRPVVCQPARSRRSNRLPPLTARLRRRKRPAKRGVSIRVEIDLAALGRRQDDATSRVVGAAVLLHRDKSGWNSAEPWSGSPFLDHL